MARRGPNRTGPAAGALGNAWATCPPGRSIAAAEKFPKRTRATAAQIVLAREAIIRKFLFDRRGRCGDIPSGKERSSRQYGSYENNENY
jgi:hypothetical protein